MWQEGICPVCPKQLKITKSCLKELEIGEITLRDIVKELEKPARDPRDEMPKPILRTDVLDMKDLKEGMILKGTVRNVIDFGVFVDIGVHQMDWYTFPRLQTSISSIRWRLSVWEISLM